MYTILISTRYIMWPTMLITINYNYTNILKIIECSLLQKFFIKLQPKLTLNKYKKQQM